MLLDASGLVHEDIVTLNVVENTDVPCDEEDIALRELSENVITNELDDLQVDTNSNTSQGSITPRVEPQADGSNDSDAFYNEEISEDENVEDTITNLQVMY